MLGREGRRKGGREGLWKRGGRKGGGGRERLETLIRGKERRSERRSDDHKENLFLQSLSTIGKVCGWIPHPSAAAKELGQPEKETAKVPQQHKRSNSKIKTKTRQEMKLRLLRFRFRF